MFINKNLLNNHTRKNIIFIAIAACLCACTSSAQSTSTNTPSPTPGKTAISPTPISQLAAATDTAVPELTPLPAATEVSIPVPILMVLDPDNPPYSFLDPVTNEYHGYSMDVMTALAQFASLELDILSVPYASQRESIAVCSADLAPTLLWQKGSFEEIYSEPYFFTPQALISRSNGLSFVSTENLTDLRIGASTHITLSTLPTDHVVTFFNHESAILDLLNEEFDGIVTSLPAAEYYQKRYVDDTQISTITTSIESYAVAVCPDQPELLYRVNEALFTIEDQGLLHILEQKWLSGTPGHVPVNQPDN